MTMSDHTTIRGNETADFIVSFPPFHSVIALVGLIVAFVIVAWTLMEGSYRAATGAGVYVLFCLLALIDTVTARVWIAGDRIWVKRWAVSVRSFAISDIVLVTFDPGELFEVQLTNRRRLRFPGAGRNLAGFTDALISRLPGGISLPRGDVVRYLREGSR